MIAQLDLFAEPAPVVARATPPARPAPLVSPTGGTDDPLPAITVNISPEGQVTVVEDKQLPAWRLARREGREIIAIDPKRLRSRFDGGKEGDVRASYSAQSLAEDDRVTSPFRFNGGEWVQTGGLYSSDGDEFECYRIVPVEQFEGDALPYSAEFFDTRRERAIGGYHGMSAKHGGRTVVLVGPPIILIEGQPEQGALL